MSNNSAIEHRANYYYVELREEFLIICMNCTYKKEGKKSAASPHCKALILAILENWTNNKRGKKEDTAIFMTYKQWSDAMYGMFGRTVIIDSLDELLGDGLISKESYRIPGNKDSYKYRLNCQELNKRLKQLPERDIHDTRPKMDASKNIPVDPSKNKPDASKNGRVTRPKMDAYPSKNGRFIESNIDSINIDSTERMNDAPQQKSNVSAEQRSSHSINQSSSSSQKSSEETKPEVVFSPEAEQVYQFAEKLNLVALKRDANHRDSCNTLIEKGVITFEKFESLYKFVKQIPFYADKTLNLKNLVKESPGWLQKQEKKPLTVGGLAMRDLREYNKNMQEQYKKPGVARSSYDDPDYIDDGFYPTKVSAAQVAEKISTFSARYEDEENNETNVKKAEQMITELGIDRGVFWDNMFHAQFKTDLKGRTMSAFFEHLRQILEQKIARRAS